MTGQPPTPDRRRHHQQDQPPPDYDELRAPLLDVCPMCRIGWHHRCKPDLWWCTCDTADCGSRLRIPKE